MNNYLQIKTKQKKCRCLLFTTAIAMILFSPLMSASHLYGGTNKVQKTTVQVDLSRLKVTADFQEKSLEEILRTLGSQTKLEYIFHHTVKISPNEKFSLSVKNMPIKEALNILLSGSKYKYNIEGNKLFILNVEAQATKSEVVSVNGKVVDDDGAVISGATVIVKGSTTGAITDSKGAFTLKAPLNSVLEISYVGFITQYQNVIKSSATTIIKMKPDVVAVNDVVIIGYGERKKKELISSVSTITSDQLKESTASSVVGLLQGKVAGLEVTTQSGGPGGGGNKVAVRGYTDIGLSSGSHSGAPLYVVDGIPINSNVSSLSGTDPLAMIDPATIESVDILKDAASAAIYGSRAANGVILITTKKGKKGQSGISASVQYAVSQISTSPTQSGGNLERMYSINALRSHLRAGKEEDGTMRYPNSYWDNSTSGTEYDAFWNDGYGRDEPMLQDSLNSFYNNSTHWFKEVFKLGKVFDAKVQSQGGTDKMQYMVSGGYYDETGIMYASDFSRLTLSSNINMQPTKRIKLNSQIALAYADRSTGPGSGGPFSPQHAVEGFTVSPTSTSTLLPSDDVTKKDLFSKLSNTVSKKDEYSVRAGLQATINILNGLDLSASASVNLGQSNSNVYVPSTLDIFYHEGTSVGRVARSIQMQNENLLTYKRQFGEVHNIDLLAGFSLYKNQSHELNGYGKGNPSDLIHYFKNSGESFILDGYGQPRSIVSYYSSFEENAMLSLFFRGAYNYKQKYLMEFSIRRDGSSMFGENNKYATFPSIAVGWNIKEESFMRSVEWLDIAKLRLSWGKSGQVFSAPYLSHGVLEGNSKIDGRSTIRPVGNLVNKDLTWEKSDQYNFGLDMNFLNYRINAKLDYYYKFTHALLAEIDMPGNFYYSQKQDRNAGEVSNKGIELELNVDILRETQVKWKMGFNISRNWNMFIKSYDNIDAMGLIIGRPIYMMESYVDNGIYQSDDEVPIFYTKDGAPRRLTSTSTNEVYKAGQRRISDMNNDGIIDDNDIVYYGSTLPKAFGGWTNNLKWRGLSLDLHFSYTLGRNIVPLYTTSSLSMVTGPYFSDLSESKFWQKPGDGSTLPQNNNFSNIVGYNSTVSSEIQSVNYVKLKQLTFGYNIPKNVMKKLGMTDIRVYFTAENVFTLTNYRGMDPEVVSLSSGRDDMSSYPLSRKFSFGINVKF